MIGIMILSGMAYGFFPKLASMMIAQGLTNRGFENVIVRLGYPSFHALTIHRLSFSTSVESGSHSIVIDNTEITYSPDSLLNSVIDTVDIGHMTIAWNSSLLERPSSPSPSFPARQPDSRIDLTWLRSETLLPVLPFRHLLVRTLEISNPLAPPALQQISITANLDSLPGGYEGTIFLEGGGLPLNLLTFSFEEKGMVALTGTHTNVPEDPVFSVETSLDRSSPTLMLKGKATLNLHPLVQTLGALYPIPSDYQSLTGTFSGTWTGTFQEYLSQSGFSLGPIQGDFSLEANMPTWPHLAQDIRLLTQGTYSMDDRAITIALRPSSSGTVSLSLNSLFPPALAPFISHEGIRSLAWNIRHPVHLVVPLNQFLDAVKIQTGQIQIAMRNSSEQLDTLISPNGLLWTQAKGITGNAKVTITTHLKPASTPSLRLETLSLEVSASIMSLPDRMTVTLNPSSLFRLSNLDNATLHIPALEGRFPKGLTWTYHIGHQTWKLQTAASTVSLPSFFLEGNQWKLGDILTKDLMVTATPERWVMNAETTVTQVRPPAASFKIPPSDWQARYSVNSTSATVQYNGQTLVFPLHVGGLVRLNRLTGEGSGTMMLHPVQFSPQALVLSQLIQPLPNPDMDITHGTVSASAKVTFNQNTSAADKSFQLTRLHGMVDFKEMGGFYKPTIMQGLTTRVEILGEDETLRIPHTPLRIKRIESAVGLTDTSLLFSTGRFPQTSIPTLSITNMNTHLLGGKVSLAEAVIDPSATTHEVTLQVRGLDLGEILRLEQQEAVKGTGTLDGTLPLFISGKEITVKQGSIQGRPPGGTLQFEVSEETASSWARSQPNLDLILKSLQNYQYSKLAVGVDYEKNGILKLATQLEGKNPDFRNGVPIHFNLNIEENIPALMKSLSLMKDLENKIEKIMTGTGKASAKKAKESSAFP